MSEQDIDDEKLNQLVSMGFDWIEAGNALEAISKWDMDATFDYLLQADDVPPSTASHEHHPTEDDAVPTPSQAKKTLSSKATCKIAPEKGDHDILVGLKLDERLRVQLGPTVCGEENSDEAFGISLSFSATGNILAVGARPNNDNGFKSGRVSVYQLVNGNWVLIRLLDAGNSGSQHEQLLGERVALSGDGTIVASGGPQDEQNAPGCTVVHRIEEG